MVKNIDYRKMSYEELEKAKRNLAAQGEKIKEERRLIDKIMQEKVGEERLRQEIGAKSPEEKAKMREILDE